MAYYSQIWVAIKPTGEPLQSILKLIFPSLLIIENPALFFENRGFNKLFMAPPLRKGLKLIFLPIDDALFNLLLSVAIYELEVKKIYC
jgi:hypothetical protein